MTNAKNPEIQPETVGELFVRRMDDLHLTAQMVAEKLSFTSNNVIAMIRSGRMRLPINRVILASKVLECNPIYLIRLLAEEMKDSSNDDRLLEVVTIAMEQEPLTAGEWEMVKLYRKFTHNRDVLLSKDFKEEWGMIELIMEEVKEKVSTNVQGYADRRRKIRRGPQPGFQRRRAQINDLTGDDDAEASPEQSLKKSVEDDTAELQRLAALKKA